MQLFLAINPKVFLFAHKRANYIPFPTPILSTEYILEEQAVWHRHWTHLEELQISFVWNVSAKFRASSGFTFYNETKIWPMFAKMLPARAMGLWLSLTHECEPISKARDSTSVERRAEVRHISHMSLCTLTLKEMRSWCTKLCRKNVPSHIFQWTWVLALPAVLWSLSDESQRQISCFWMFNMVSGGSLSSLSL